MACEALAVSAVAERVKTNPASPSCRSVGVSAVKSSGAISAGTGELGWSKRPTELRLKQAAAAVGQVCLMEKYRHYFRRQRIKIENFETWIVSKEDLILSKLFWARDSHSELQLRDVRNLIAAGCDRTYIEQWTAGLGLSMLWQEVSHD